MLSRVWLLFALTMMTALSWRSFCCCCRHDGHWCHHKRIGSMDQASCPSQHCIRNPPYKKICSIIRELPWITFNSLIISRKPYFRISHVHVARRFTIQNLLMPKPPRGTKGISDNGIERCSTSLLQRKRYLEQGVNDRLNSRWCFRLLHLQQLWLILIKLWLNHFTTQQDYCKVAVHVASMQVHVSSVPQWLTCQQQ